MGMHTHRRRPVRSNVVVLPDGFYYGNLDPDSAMATVETHLAGTVLPDRLRGMARFLPPVRQPSLPRISDTGHSAPQM